MNSVNFLKPNKESLNLFLVLGSTLFVFGLFGLYLRVAERKIVNHTL